MNKAELIAKMAETSGLSKKDAELALNAFQSAIIDALQAGEKVALVGFGTYAVKDRAARVGQNPRTGEKIEIAASKTPVFLAGKNLKEAIQ